MSMPAGAGVGVHDEPRLDPAVVTVEMVSGKVQLGVWKYERCSQGGGLVSSPTRVSVGAGSGPVPAHHRV
ncbi:MAG: hypothetical protein JWL99_2174 [Streptomyces oryziradicis]|nr:hypothetical protein [Actinacidiphila oryziradicis]